jgi:hypothetical protein
MCGLSFNLHCGKNLHDLNKVEIEKLCNIMKTNTRLSEEFQAPVEKS